MVAAARDSETFVSSAQVNIPGALEGHQARLEASSAALKTYIADLVTEREAAPDPESDVTSGLLAAGLPPDLVAGCIRLLLSAGHETTTGSLGFTLDGLIRRERWQSYGITWLPLRFEIDA